MLAIVVHSYTYVFLHGTAGSILAWNLRGQAKYDHSLTTESDISKQVNV